jgi:mono/diheme cytochrome c family protein
MPKYILVVTTLALSWLVVRGTAAQAPTPATQAQPAPQPGAQPPTGDVKRGKELFEKTYRCYSCHGFDGQTGSPRLVPMARTQEAFVAYVRKPATQGMPKFPAVAEQDLADVYAYIRSIPVVAPPVDAIPLLKDVIDRRSGR